VQEYFEFNSIFKTLTLIDIRTGHQRGQISDGDKNIQISFSLCLKFRSMKKVLSLLKDTKQYVQQSHVHMEVSKKKTARRKVDIILFVGMFVQRT